MSVSDLFRIGMIKLECTRYFTKLLYQRSQDIVYIYIYIYIYICVCVCVCVRVCVCAEV